jgi:FkbM family methyltransferase
MSLARLMRFVWMHPLNRGGRMQALSRFVRWQLASRLLPEARFALPFVNESSLLMRRGMTGATGNWYCGLDEADDMAFVVHLLRRGDLFVDIGANIGSYSILAAAGAGADAIAIEPIPATFDSLSRNITVSRLETRVRSCAKGLSRVAGTLRFTTTQDSVNHVLAEGEDAVSAEVPVITLDMLLEESEQSRAPTAIKIDVEGHELAVLEGAAKTLRSPDLKAVVMETNGSGARYGYSDEALIDIMKGHGFQPHTYTAVGRTVRAAPHIQGTGNTIFLRDLPFVEQRLRSAPRVRLVTGWL